MSFTPPEHQSMLDRAHHEIDRRDRLRTMRHRVGLVTVLAFVACAAAILWWPQMPVLPVQPTPSPSSPDSRVAEATQPLRLPAPPAWLQIIDTDEEIEAGFAEAGECARVVRVDHKIMAIACSELAILPRIEGP